MERERLDELREKLLNARIGGVDKALRPSDVLDIADAIARLAVLEEAIGPDPSEWLKNPDCVGPSPSLLGLEYEGSLTYAIAAAERRQQQEQK